MEAGRPEHRLWPSSFAGPAFLMLASQRADLRLPPRAPARAGNGIDFADFHDHVLDSVPGTGHGEFNPLWHVFLIIPTSFDPAAQAAYAAHLPIRSEADVDALVDSGLATRSTRSSTSSALLWTTTRRTNSSPAPLHGESVSGGAGNAAIRRGAAAISRLARPAGPAQSRSRGRSDNDRRYWENRRAEPVKVEIGRASCRE